MREDPPEGLRHVESIRVDDSLIVPALSNRFPGFSDMPPVFATAYLVAFVEWTCVEALRRYLSPEQRTVGVGLSLSHQAATPIGMNVTAAVELTAATGKLLTFSVLCRDENEVISEGEHQRFIVDANGFMARVQEKASSPRESH